MNGVLIVACITASIFGIVYVFVTSRHRERIAMIERGVSAEIFVGKSQNLYLTLKFGMLSVGIAIGLLLGFVLAEHHGMPEGPAYFSMIFLMGGISLIINFFVERSLTSRDDRA